MEITRLEYLKANIYIPPSPKMDTPKIPKQHPSLIIADQLVDAGKTFKCGCKGDKCIKETANWLYGPNGEVNNPCRDCTSTEAYHFKNLIHDSDGRQL